MNALSYRNQEVLRPLLSLLAAGQRKHLCHDNFGDIESIRFSA
jgi:hypothetical protein